MNAGGLSDRSWVEGMHNGLGWSRGAIVAVGRTTRLMTSSNVQTPVTGRDLTSKSCYSS